MALHCYFVIMVTTIVTKSVQKDKISPHTMVLNLLFFLSFIRYIAKGSSSTLIYVIPVYPLPVSWGSHHPTPT